jgi:hypothetical protein
MVKFTVSYTALLLGCCWSSPCLAACAVNDSAFTTADGGCKDLNPGLVWSPDWRGLTYSSGGGASTDAQINCDVNLNQHPDGGGYTDCRLPTLGEVQEALANGLNSHLDFFDDGEVTPDDGLYRWTSCTKKVRGLTNRYAIRYTDESVILSYVSGLHVICVRGAASYPAIDCPGNGKKNRVGATSSLSQTATGALLLLPLGVVLAARCLRPRRP